MALETILEFDKNNRYKVKLEVGNVDTSTVDSVKIDEEIAYLLQEDRHTFSFCTREFYKDEGECEGEREHIIWDEEYGDYPRTSWGIVDWDCEYYIDRFWDIKLENGELVLKNTKAYDEIIFTKENFPEDTDGYDFEDELDKDAKYDVLITYEKLVEKDEVANLFTEKDKDELEQLKVQINDNFYSVTSITPEIDWELCKGYARERGVSDKYLTEVNLNRALELALEGIVNQYSFLKYCFIHVKDGLIHLGTYVGKYEDTAEEDIATIRKSTIDGAFHLYVSGELQNETSKIKEYKELIARISFYVKWFKQQKGEVDTYIQRINAKIKDILPYVMKHILTIAEDDKNKEWFIKKIDLAKELEQAVELYLKTKREIIGLLEDEIGKKFELDVSDIVLYLDDSSKFDTLERYISVLKETLTNVQLGASSFSMLQVAEAKFEDTLRHKAGHCLSALTEVRLKLEKLLSEHSDNEKMAQEIEEALSLTKQPKVITAEEEMVSAWNKYIGLKMEGKE